MGAIGPRPNFANAAASDTWDFAEGVGEFTGSLQGRSHRDCQALLESFLNGVAGCAFHFERLLCC